MRSIIIRFILGAIVFGICAIVTSFILKKSVNKDVVRYVCNLVSEKFYKNDARLIEWVKNCKLIESDIGYSTSSKETLDLLQRHMNEMEVSHLEVYSPVEDQMLWKGVSKENGIVPIGINGQFIVKSVHPQSPASRMNVQAGDIVLDINGEVPATPWDITNSTGQFRFQRGEAIFTTILQSEELSIDSSPRLKELKPGVASLTISSFRTEYFNKKKWRAFSQDFKKYNHIIVDVRGNRGGNFVSMLRGLSTFFCQTSEIGSLVQPRMKLAEGNLLPDIIDEGEQLRFLERNKNIKLKTFSSYPCYQNRVTILVDLDTASVAEIFAYAFFKRKNSRVWGQVTSGHVVLAVWYEIPVLGKGYSVSIPEAVYLSHDGKNLESVGVWPEKQLFYSFEEAVEGKDSWIESAIR